MVTVTPLPPGIRPPFFNVNPTAPMPRAQPTRSGAVVVQPGARSTQIGQVSVQRLPASAGQQQRVSSKLDKGFLKATHKGKKDMKKFTLRNVYPSIITSSDDLKDLIKTNLRDDIWPDDFDVGYMMGTEVIRVQTEEDLEEMWGDIKKSSSTALWCDGLIDDESDKPSKSGKTGGKGSVQLLMVSQMMKEVSLQRHRKRRR